MDLMSSRVLPMAGYLWGGSMKDWLMDMEEWLRRRAGSLGALWEWDIGLFLSPKNHGVREEIGRKLLVCGGIGKGNDFSAKIPPKAGNL